MDNELTKKIGRSMKMKKDLVITIFVGIIAFVSGILITSVAKAGFSEQLPDDKEIISRGEYRTVIPSIENILLMPTHVALASDSRLLLEEDEEVLPGEEFPILVPSIEITSIAPKLYPLGDPLRVATPGIPFFGVEIETGFVCMIPGDWWVDCYGAPRDHGSHKGWDYVMESMDTWKVYSPMAGVVTFSENIYPYGDLVVIENNGFQMFLAHHEEILVAVGDIVQAGDHIAMAGDTGKSFGPHVHFEVRRCDILTGNCGVVDQREVNLPGQSEACTWDLGITQTIQRFGRTYTCGWGIDTYVSASP